MGTRQSDRYAEQGAAERRRMAAKRISPYRLGAASHWAELRGYLVIVAIFALVILAGSIAPGH